MRRSAWLSLGAVSVFTGLAIVGGIIASSGGSSLPPSSTAGDPRASAIATRYAAAERRSKLEKVASASRRACTDPPGRRRHRKPIGELQRKGDRIPGGIAKDVGPWFSSDTIYPIINSWVTADRRCYTAVQAGADPYDKSRGVFGILRQDHLWVTQKEDVVYVRDSGPVKITTAPLGRSVETWAQMRGNIHFVGIETGVTGTLHLRNDEVTIDP